MTITLSMLDGCGTCSSAYKKIQEQYAELANCPVNKLLDCLFANGVITLDDKKLMESIPLEKNRMTYLLDDVLKSLNTDIGLKYNKLLEVLEGSDDCTIRELTRKLGQYNFFSFNTFNNFCGITYVVVKIKIRRGLCLKIHLCLLITLPVFS